jgi:hypothetical protein
MRRFYICTTDELAEYIEQIAPKRGFDSAAAFIRQTISNDLHSRESVVRETVLCRYPRAFCQGSAKGPDRAAGTICNV